MSKLIYLSLPNMVGNEVKYATEAIKETWVSTGGAYVKELEKRLADFIGAENVAVCQSGTSALHLSLIECGVQPGDIVIVPTLTFIAAVNPVLYQFAEPVFMDCDDSLCMDPVKLQEFCENECTFEDGKLIYSGKQVKAIVVVHVFGNMADMEAIMHIAEKYNIKVIEDATEALGTKYSTGKYQDCYAGTIGHFGAYSFNGNKIITTGGGGAVTANDPMVVDHLRYLSTQAKDDPHYYLHNEVGYNYRMTNLQAALGVAQMEKLQEFIEIKHRNYKLYKEKLGQCDLCRLLSFRKGTDSNMWFYSLEVDRTRVHAPVRWIITELEKCGIQTRAIWGLIHEQKPYKAYRTYNVEKAEYYSRCILNIPCSTNLSLEDVQIVSGEIEKVLRKAANG